MTKYPSQERYEKANPSICIRMTADLKNQIDESKGELSYPTYIKAILKKSVDELNKDALIQARMHGFDIGKEAAAKEFQITYPCCVCGTDVSIEPGDTDHEFIKKKLREGLHGHASCIEKKYGKK